MIPVLSYRRRIWQDIVLLGIFLIFLAGSSCPAAAGEAGGPAGQPIARFSAAPVRGAAPLTVVFTDTSSGSPEWWSWSFGDGGTSTEKDPAHVFRTPNSFLVILEVGNAAGNSSATGIISTRTGTSVLSGKRYGNDTGIADIPNGGATIIPAAPVVTLMPAGVPGEAGREEMMDVLRLRSRSEYEAMKTVVVTTNTVPPSVAVQQPYPSEESPAPPACVTGIQPDPTKQQQPFSSTPRSLINRMLDILEDLADWIRQG